jgi:signal transduction histidine kinase
MALRALTPALILPLLASAVQVLGPRPASGQPASPRTVLVLHWSTEDFPTNPIVTEAIRESFASAGLPVDLNTEYLESDRFPATASNALREYIRRKYQGRRIELVIAIAEPALNFALDARPELFQEAPIVYSGVSGRSGGIRSEHGGLAGVVSGAAYAATAELALKMHPGTTRMVVIAYAPNSPLEESARSALESVAQRVKISYITETAIPELLAAVRTVPRDSLILYVRHSQDEPGKVLNPAEVASLVARASPVPVYGIADQYIGFGVIGGVLTETHAVGKHVADIARRILDGTRPETIPIEELPRATVFDARELGRWGLSERSLPAGSIVRFRTPSVWEQHRTAIVATIAVILLQSMLIAGLVFEHRRRRKAEMESRRNLAAMAHLDRRAAMGELATSLAHELNQPLNAILQNAGVAEMLLRSNAVPAALREMPDIIGDIRKDDMRASEMIRRMRGLLQKHELESHPVDLNEVAQETVAIVRPDARSREIQLEMELADDVHTILGDRVHLQQVLLNLLMNAIDAVADMPVARRRVRVWTRQTDVEARLAVADAGTGIPADRISDVFEPFYTTKTEGSGMGMGLAIARSIVEAHAGRMAAENNAGGGATVWFSVPISRAPQPPVHGPASPSH